jgi:methionine-rich copper-binding protein CopC
MKQMKKLLAFVLAFAMIITIYQPSAAYAATKKIRLNAKTMTLQVGQKKTLKVKNAGKKAKLKWSSNKKSVATVSKKGVVKAVKAGNTVVTCKVTTKNGKTTKLTCKVAVKKTAKVTSLTVGSQKELEKALKNKNVRKITVATQGAVTFTVPQGNYSKVDLVINAPNADVVNNGKFKSIDIQAIKPNTYRENAKGNSIKITAVDARIIVEAGASLAKVSVTQEGGKIKIEASGTIDAVEISAPVIVDLAVDGKIGEVNVKAAAVLSVEGKTTTAVPIKVSEKAAGASVVSSTPVDVKAAADISLTLSKGAEGSKVAATGEKTEVAVKNDTATAVKVETPSGTQEVATGTSSKVNSDGKNTETTTTNPGYTYTSPDPLKLTNIMVRSSQKIAAYFNQTVPAEIASEAVTVTDAAGNKVNIDKIYRHQQDTQAYYMEFSEKLQTGEYTITISISGIKFVKKFTYDGSVWASLDAAKKIVQAEMEKTHIASVSGLKSAEICRHAFEEDLKQELSKDTEACKIERWSVQTRPFKYEEEYPDETVEKDHAMVSIWVGIYKGDANYMMNDFVDFACTGDAITVSEPTIVKQLKESIVVSYETGYEYACVTSGTAISDVPEEKWDGYADRLGNYEIKNLTNNTEYVLYKRLKGCSEMYAQTTFSLDKNADEFEIILKEPDQTTINLETVTSGSAIAVDFGKGMLKYTYGTVPDELQEIGSISFENLKIQQNGYDWNRVSQETGWCIVDIHWNDELFHEGSNTVKFEISFGYAKNDGTIVKQSKSVEITVNFTVQ